MIWLLGSLGAAVMSVFVHGSRVSAVSGAISPIKSIHKRRMGVMAIGRPRSPAPRRLRRTVRSSPPLEVRLASIVFLMF